MHLSRTDTALRLIRGHLNGAEEGVIASFLAQYLAIVFYAEMEEQVGAKVREHITRCSGRGIGQFIQSNMDGMIKRTPKSDIGKLVGQFGERFKSDFEQRIDDRSVTRYSNVITARHAIGHRQGSNITIGEVEQGLHAGNLILDALQGCFEADAARAEGQTSAAPVEHEQGRQAQPITEEPACAPPAVPISVELEGTSTEIINVSAHVPSSGEARRSTAHERPWFVARLSGWMRRRKAEDQR